MRLATEDRIFLDGLKNREESLNSSEVMHLLEIIKKVDWENLIFPDDYIAEHLWTEDDVRQQLAELEYEATDAQVEAVLKSGRLKGLGDITEDEWALLEYACDETMEENGELHVEKIDMLTPVSVYGTHVRVDWNNADEGVCGDYNPEDPDDINFLRFDVYYRDSKYAEWVEVEDSSYCTQMPADTPERILIQAAKAICKEYANVLEADPDQSVKKLGEQLSWISPNDFQ